MGGVDLRGLCSIAINKVIALIGHAMLDRDAAAERRNTIDITPVNCLAVVEEPVEPFERNIAVDFLVNVERAADRLVVCCVHAPGPAVLREQANDFLQFRFHVGGHFRARHLEVFVVGGGVNERLAGTIGAVGVIPLARFHQLGPVREILEFLLRPLREQVVGNADGQLAVTVELVDDLVVLRVVLEAAAGIDDASHPKAIEFAHEMPS